MKPNLLSHDDAINLLVVIQQLTQADLCDATVAQSAAGLADLLTRNAAAVRFSTNATPRPPPSADQLIERMQGRNGDLQRAVSFVVRARLQLVATPQVDFATLELVDFLLGVSSMIMLTTDLDDECSETVREPVDAAPDMTATLRFPRSLVPSGALIH